MALRMARYVSAWHAIYPRGQIFWLRLGLGRVGWPRMALRMARYVSAWHPKPPRGQVFGLLEYV